MAEKNKESSSADSKDKGSLLDEDIGKEFLSSWKTMSMADDDTMDFGFDSIPKGKKKTFDFEKLDMNFNLDGDFKNISSFKMDMSDLDFACTPKKSSQSKDKKGESSGGGKAGKQDAFNFSFDFNELDNFNLDPSLIKRDASSNKNLREKVITAEESDNAGAKMPKASNDENAHASTDSIAIKPQASERLEKLKIETSVGNLGNLDSGLGSSTSKLSSLGSMDVSIVNQASDINKIAETEEMNKEKYLCEMTKSTESMPVQVTIKESYQLVGQSDPEKDIIPEEVNVSGEKPKVNDEAIYMDSDGVDLHLEHSSLMHSTGSDNTVGENLGSSTQGVTNDPQPEKSDKSLEDTAKSDAPMETSCDNDIIEKQNSSLECQLAPTSSKSLDYKTKLMKDKELQGTQSNIISRPEDKSSIKHHASTAGAKSITFGCQRNGDMNLRSITQARSNSTSSGSKLAIDLLPASSKLMRPLLDSKDGLKSGCNMREGTSSVTPSAGRLTGNEQLFHQEVNKSKAIFPGTRTSAKDVSILNSQLNPSCLAEKTTRNATQMSVNSQAEVSAKESSQKSRMSSIDGSKLASVKACKITPPLSSLKSLRNIEASRVLPANIHQKEANSKVSSEQSLEIQGTKASKDHHLTDSGGNQKPLTPLLKRKTIEGLEAGMTSLRSLKRLSQSPSRNSKESLEEVIEQVQSKPANLICQHPSFGLESSSEIKVKEIEVTDSILMENNSNVGKAEACMKELEDICNMLRKKHEEAKELLVRAIVNDNNLLMLNHPIYEEEISFILFCHLLLVNKFIYYSW
ncbi:hypothetical protein S245_045469 [Arachis hypogaea]